MTQNAVRSLRYMAPFFKRGFNILLIEHRNHGRSGGTNTTYGYFEKYDLKAWVDWVLQHNGQVCRIGVHGESMGAAIAIQHAAIDSRTAFIVADCPFARAADEFAYHLKVEYHLPRFPLIPLASLICQLRAGFSFGKISPLDVIPDLQLPVLFIHGAEDDYIPPQDSERLFAAKPGLKQLWLAPGSKHAVSQKDHPEDYDRYVGEFLANIGLNKTV
ncbi:MAG: alpha/beta hydrolase [Anaerolineae bacterium]|nr:alpha/beta hydrolase [Anaerolineae bacterium]